MNITQHSLNSSIKTKLKVTRAFTQATNSQSIVSGGDRSRTKTSIHTITAKQSPHKFYQTTVGFSHQLAQPHSPPKWIAVRRTSPISKITQIANIPTGQGLKNRQSITLAGPVQGILVTQDKRRGSKSKQRQPMQPFDTISCVSLTQIRSPMKPRLSQDRHFVKLQHSPINRRLSSTNMLPAPPQIINIASNQPATTHIQPHNSTSHRPSIYKMTSAPKTEHKQSIHMPKVQVLKEINQNKGPREIELERKIKVLEIRVGELHLEKGSLETRMNELIIRLQYENNFLKEKLNSYPSLTQINIKQVDEQTLADKNNLKVIDEVLSQQSQNTLFFTCPIKPNTLRSIENNLMSDSSRSNGQKKGSLNVEFVDTEEHYYNANQSTQVHVLKQKLSEAEDMLSKQIAKNMKLLEDLDAGQKAKQWVSQEMKKLQQLNQDLTTQLQTLKSTNIQVQVANESARITRQFQDKILGLEMEISWLNDKIQPAQKMNSHAKLELDKYSHFSKVDLIDQEQIFAKLQILKEHTEMSKENNELKDQVVQLKDQVVQLKNQVVQLKDQIVQLKDQVESLRIENSQLREKNDCYANEVTGLKCQTTEVSEQMSQLHEQIESLKSKSSQAFIPEQVLQQQKQTNQILQSTIRSLQKSLAFSEQSIHELMTQKIDLESKVHQLQLQLNQYLYKEQQYELEIHTISFKLQQINQLVEFKSKQIASVHNRIHEQQDLLTQKQHVIWKLEKQLQSCNKQNDQPSTLNSYYDKSTHPNSQSIQYNTQLIQYNYPSIHSFFTPKFNTF